jgi:aminoglycoside phosphotransferase (APT) family kinase protein
MSEGEIGDIVLSLRDAQLVVAREYNFENWAALKEQVEEEAAKPTREESLGERKEKQTSSDEEINPIVRTASGSDVESKERISGGYSCEVWRVKTTDGQDLVYRANWFANWDGKEGVHFENEKWALQKCESEGIPASRFHHVEHGLSGYPTRSVIVNSFVEGDPLKQLMATELSGDSLESVLFEVGRLMGNLHQLKTNGFGRLDGNGPIDSWRAAYLGQLDVDRLREAADNVDLPRPLIEEGIALLEGHAHLGEGVEPCLLHGDFRLEHVIVKDGHVAGLIDFEHCAGGDPASEMNWFGDSSDEGWWDRFTGDISPRYPVGPLLRGYREVADVDGDFKHRSVWLTFCRQLSGLGYHSVQDIDTAGMKEFLNWRYREDLGVAQRILI